MGNPFTGIMLGGMAQERQVQRTAQQEDKRINLLERQLSDANRSKLAEGVNNSVRQTFDLLKQGIESADLTGVSRQKVMDSMIDVIQDTRATIEQGVQAGVVPGSMLTSYNAQLRGLATSPTPEQMTKAKAEEAGAVEGAKTSAKLKAESEIPSTTSFQKELEELVALQEVETPTDSQKIKINALQKRLLEDSPAEQINQIRLGLLNKLQQGGEASLTEGEKRVLRYFERLDPIQAILAGLLGGVSSPATTRKGDLLKSAKDAVNAGKPVSEIRRVLKDAGATDDEIKDALK